MYYIYIYICETLLLFEQRKHLHRWNRNCHHTHNFKFMNSFRGRSFLSNVGGQKMYFCYFRRQWHKLKKVKARAMFSFKKNYGFSLFLCYFSTLFAFYSHEEHNMYLLGINYNKQYQACLLCVLQLPLNHPFPSFPHVGFTSVLLLHTSTSFYLMQIQTYTDNNHLLCCCTSSCNLGK